MTLQTITSLGTETLNFDYSTKSGLVPGLTFSTGSSDAAWIYGAGYGGFGSTSRISITSINQFTGVDSIVFSTQPKLLVTNEYGIDTADSSTYYIIHIIDPTSRTHGDSTDGLTYEAWQWKSDDSSTDTQHLPTGKVIITGSAIKGQTLTASNTLADADGLGTISYVWKANGVNIGTGNSYTLTGNEVGKTVTVIAGYIDGLDKAESVSSAATAVVTTPVNHTPTGDVTINDNRPEQNQILTVANTLADADGLGTISYQWSADNTVIGTGNSYTLTQAEVGKKITVTASYTDNQNTAETVTSAATAAVTNVNDLPTGAVTITGTAKQGEVLTASNNLADVDGLGTISYRWNADGTVIGSGSSYTLSQAEVGKTITLTAGYFDGQNTAEMVTSAATAAVANINDLPTGAVTITGTAKQGEVLTATNSLADADGLGTITYQWNADGNLVGSGNSYTLSQAEVGKKITVTAGYTDSQNTVETVSSAATAAVANVNDLPTGAVTITGTAKQGEVLTASNSLADIDGLGVISYQWNANGAVIGSGDSYTLTANEVGKTITAVANYTDNQNTAESVSSKATAAVAEPDNHAPTGEVTITGSTLKGQTLTAANTLADADGLGTVSYQWQANDVTVGTGNSYTLTANEVGKTVTVIASYIDGLGKAESVTSAGTGAITAPTTPGFTVSPTTLQSTGENGTTVSYSIQLNTAPLAKQNVVLNFTSSDTSEGIISTPTLTFTSANYATPQTLTVQGVDDYLDDGNIPYLVTAKVTTLDVFYKTLAFTALNLTNIDDGLDTPLDLYGDENGSKSDVLTGGNGADKLHGLNKADNLSGGLGNDSIWGGYGDDNLFGEDGGDKLFGEQENDYLEGGAGNDSLDGGDGADTMMGGAGNDTYYLGYDAVDVITDNGLATDIDTVIMPYQLTSYTLPSGIEQGTIAAGTVASNLTGNTGDNSLTGNGGKNTLNGAVGRDSLFGGAGSDILLGGAGNDTLSGGSGKDIFKFNTAFTANTDKITDFVVADDTIQLENSIFTKLTKTGVLSTDNFVKGATAHDGNDYVVYNSNTGAVIYDADGSGAGVGVQIALLGANLALTHADFVVI